MKYSVNSFIKELSDNQIITSEAASKIEKYYQNKHDKGGNRLLAIFGVLGALLVGTGIILIVAHNWDDLSRSFKTILAFVPVLIGLGACGFSLFKKEESFTWKEASAVFLTFGFGACIALISQIYNIPGSMQDFLFTWIIAILPLVYIMWSSITSILVIIGLTVFGILAGYENAVEPEKYYCWLFLALLIPFYWRHWNINPNTNALYFHHWLIPGAITILLGSINEGENRWIIPAYMAVFSCFYIFSGSVRFQNQGFLTNGYKIIGSLGSIILLMTLSFQGFWESMIEDGELLQGNLSSLPFIITIILMASGVYMLYQRKFISASIADYTFLIFLPIFLLGFWSMTAAVIGINILILAFSVYMIYKGVKINHLGVVNYGLLCMTALIACRFFDVDIPFFMKGIVFILVGFAFFYSNYRMIQERKTA